MKKYKLKKWVSNFIYLSALVAVIVGLAVVSKTMNDRKPDKDVKYVSEDITEDEKLPVINETSTIAKPYTGDNVEITKTYYTKDKNEEEKQKSLIFYKNTYMENTGILYTKGETFDVVSVLDGTVTSVTKDEIMGNVVEITHSNDLITRYECLSDVTVKEGDEVKQYDVIGHSGKTNIDEGYGNALLFEVNYKGSIINPEDFYKMNASDLMK